ncbi:unnamed protein product [Lymnaea stagnalis]|uniref:Uncharacterized protein n=1 Tax=Lymnaea stagnalis TaxID=6523 RepID=A0AAV2I5R6_LYMST
MGILSVQIQGDTQISLTLAGRNNEPTEFVLRTPSALPISTVSSEPGFSIPDELGSSPGPNADEVTRKNIVDYLRQGSALRPNASLFDSILGVGSSSSTGLGIGLGISPHSTGFPGPPVHTSSFRPNNISNIAVQSSGLRGSALSFPFNKSTGAFHPPIPRLPVSAGQSNLVPKLTQQGNRPVGQPGALGFQVSHTVNATSQQSLPPSVHSFSPVGPLRHPASLSPNFHSQNSLIPPTLSASPTSNMMIDLPPPPPYPHNNSSRPGKPVTASSPLLVNLLQTDPLVVAAGMASGNPNKPISVGDPGPPPKKKKRSKKSKDGHVKPFSVTDNMASSKPVFSHLLSNSGTDLNRVIRVPDDSGTLNLPTSFNMKDSSVELQSRAGSQPASHIPDSFIPSFRPDSKPSFSADRPFGESHKDNLSFYKFQLETNSRSAIGTGNTSSKLSDSNGSDQLPKDLKDLDPFTVENAAGKIVNPYTGKLEPRDSSVETGQVRAKDQPGHSQGDNFATQILARKAKEIEELNKISVPSSSSQMSDVHVRTVSPTPHPFSNSTAGFVRSGGSFQVSNERLTSSIPIHRRNLISDGSIHNMKSSAQSSIYAVTSRQEIFGNIAEPSLSHSIVNTSLKVASGKSAVVQKDLPSTPSPVNGPVLSGNVLRHNVIPSQNELIETSSLTCGLPSAPSGSVIYSSSSSVSLQISQVSFSQPQIHQAVSISPASESASPALSRSRPTPSYPLLHSTKPFSSPSSAVAHATSDRTASLSYTQHQAASSDMIGSVHATKFSSSHLLNSISEKHMDSQSSTESPHEKVSSEGDENSNHSGLATDSLPEHSGTTALLEHAGVKIENHDSGIGSSSERSDDTPSEPGDEFRSGHAGTENDESNIKAQSTKSANCKLDSKLTPNTITVGYMINPGESASHPKMSLPKYNSHMNKKTVTTPSRIASTSDISQFLDTQSKTLDHHSGQQTSASVSWVTDNKIHFNSSSSGKAKENGPTPEDMDNIHTQKLNGPLAAGNIDKMMISVNDSQQKKFRSSPKQLSKKDISTEHIKLQAEVFEKMSKLHQFAESTKITAEIGTKGNSLEKADSPDSLSRTGGPEERADSLFFDMEELVNGKTTLGNGGVGGNNITSIYSKRSSPVNVNMLNHIYAPGLPLPRRLTESVQRLVKPLPASESSVTIPHVRTCKSPAAGTPPRASSGTNGPTTSRMSLQSGTRSPGASMPKLVPSDKHSLLSGGLDLAGLSALPYTSGHSGDGVLVNCKSGVPLLAADVLLKDSISAPNPHSPPKLALDTKTYSGKMLSKSYPPHKAREISSNSSHFHHDFRDQSNTAQNSQSALFSSKSKFETPYLSSQDSRVSQCNIKSQEHKVSAATKVIQLEMGSNHVTATVSDNSSVLSRLAAQPLAASDNAHSSHDNNGAGAAASILTSHSNASSPIMPILQQGQEPVVNSAIGVPSISSHSPSISSPQEISQVCIGSSIPSTSSAAVSALYVPYPSSTLSTTDSATATKLTSCSSPGPLPTLYPMSAASTVAAGKHETTLVATQSCLPTLKASSDLSSPPKLTKVSLPLNPFPLSPRTGSQFNNRNLFESVSGALVCDNIQSGPLTSHLNQSSIMSASLTKATESTSEWISRTMRQKLPETEGNTLPPGSSQANKADVSKSVSSVKTTNSSSDLTSSAALVCSKTKVSLASVQSSDTTVVSKSTNNSKEDSSVDESKTHDSQESSCPQAGQTTTSCKPCPEITTQNCTDNVAETIASVAAGTEKNTPKGPTSLSTVKDPILETFASTLGTQSSPYTKSVALSLGENKTSLPVDKAEEKTTGEKYAVSDCKMVTVESSPSKSLDISVKSLTNVEPQMSDASSLEASIRRVTRKRKSTHSEGDAESETSSSESTPTKQPASASHVKTLKKTISSGPSSHSKMESASKPFKDVSTLKTYSKAANFGNGDLQNKVLKMSSGHSQEDKDSTRPAKPRRASLSEDKEQTGAREGRRSGTSCSSDECRSNRSSSNESKESTNKESRTNHNTADGEGRTQKTAEDKEMRVHRASSSDFKESLHKENRFLDKEDQKEGRSQRASSADDIKAKSGPVKELLDKSAAQDKVGEDGQKKSHRIRRQFYAYVPEKSIDQTYFDTPILSGRTRSKNKPTDTQDTQDGSSNNESNHLEPNQLAAPPAPGKSEGNPDSAGAKRPTRSVRTKDNSQDQSASKRRKVQQHR